LHHQQEGNVTQGAELGPPKANEVPGMGKTKNDDSRTISLKGMPTFEESGQYIGLSPEIIRTYCFLKV